MKHSTFDVIVVGGGHAGTEAAVAAAKTGAHTLLLTHKIESIGQMSCNPAIGGIGKGHLVKEIDAMGGIMATAADYGGIQFRTLNATKGPAVRATRAQADRILYKKAIQTLVNAQENLSVIADAVDDLIIKNEQITGVLTASKATFFAPTVILTVGTFLGGKIHIGDQQSQGGRVGDPPSIALAHRLRALPFRVARLKTGTPPRIDTHSIDYSTLQEQPGDTPTPIFSFIGDASQHPKQISCHITHTNERTHEIIRNNINQSAMFSGAIEGIGPRYCPSIEDKIFRFADRNAHQIFIEPEGLNSDLIYPNGISTSLPLEVQEQFIKSIKGFESARITQPGYAIEYDYFDPRDLHPWLETHFIKGLFFAGQINGTTGYEEAGAQGLLAGINAARSAQNKAPWYPKRNEAYLGVLIDDLTTRGTQEPYRMFTSRAEHRLLLREDNADLRLTEVGRQLGTVDDQRWHVFLKKREAIEREQQRLKTTWVHPGSDSANALNAFIEKPLAHEQNVLELLRRPNVHYADLMKIEGLGPAIEDTKAAEQIEIQARYAGYIDRQTNEIEKRARHENTPLPTDMHYKNIHGLSNEAQQKLTDVHPETIGQASRIPGITPATISLLLVHLKKHTNPQASSKQPT